MASKETTASKLSRLESDNKVLEEQNNTLQNQLNELKVENQRLNELAATLETERDDLAGTVNELVHLNHEQANQDRDQRYFKRDTSALSQLPSLNVTDSVKQRYASFAQAGQKSRMQQVRFTIMDDMPIPANCVSPLESLPDEDMAIETENQTKKDKEKLKQKEIEKSENQEKCNHRKSSRKYRIWKKF